MNDEYLNFTATFKETYPEAFITDYEPLECLAQGDLGETLLVKNKLTGEMAVAKCTRPNMKVVHSHESELLKKLAHKGLPKFIREYDAGDMRISVREYVEGQPLNEMVRGKLPLKTDAIVDLGIKLCDILIYLHGQNPPVIHRDIKPQNIVIAPNGAVKLIDFGISREYDEFALTDTISFGTRNFAPPEQYGYMQTDSRSDIFSLGAVLFYLATGCTHADANMCCAIESVKLRAIVKKCLAFAPTDRYSDAESLKKALTALKPESRRRRAILATASCITAVALIAAGVVLSPKLATIFAGIVPTPAASQQAAILAAEPTNKAESIAPTPAQPSFKEPLIEKAARLMLGKDDSQSITQAELERISGLFIFQDECFDSETDFYACMSDWYTDEAREYGEISSLDDLALMPNLRSVYIGAQLITDISPLSKLERLEKFDLRANNIVDIAPLRGLPVLSTVGLNGCKVTDISPLATCPNLSNIDLCDVQRYNVDALDSFSELWFLDISNQTYSYKHLDGKTIHQMKLCYSRLDSLSWLDKVSGLEALEINGTRLKSLEGIGVHSELTYLRVSGLGDIDLTPVKELKKLETLVISEDMRKNAEALGEVPFNITYEG